MHFMERAAVLLFFIVAAGYQKEPLVAMRGLELREMLSKLKLTVLKLLSRSI